MIRDHSHREKRSAFTLVELMVVILIIAILVSLLASAVMKALGKIPEVQTSTEIAEMSAALQVFMSDYGLSDPPPSTLILNEAAPLASPSGPFLQKVFGKNLGPTDWNGDGAISGIWPLQGQQCLTFYLGGIPSNPLNPLTPGAQPGGLGFSTNNMKPSMGSMAIDYQPANPAGLPPGVGMGKRKGPYFNFVTSRLVPVQATGGFFMYLDPWQVKTSLNGVGPMPYVYFSSNGINNGYNYTDCSAVSYTDLLGSHFALPYWTGVTGTSFTYSNSNTYQIISAGKDGKFGYNPGLPPPPGALNSNLWSPTSGAVGTGADDQANFSSTLLGAGQN
jgi:prepilin-type N-terminal cleavage/methylation domain-containing protein